MKQIYRIADKTVEIESIHDEVHALCRDYAAQGAPDFSVSVTQADIERERAFADAEYRDSYLETLAVYRKISEIMPTYDTFLFHGSAIEADGAGYLFAAPSGTGKSTHTRLWRELLGGRARMINDDKPLLRVEKGGVTVFGTPWNGKHRLGSNIASPLRAVCFLERGEENSILVLRPEQAFPLLMGQVYRPRDGDAMRRTLQLLDSLCRSVGFYRLRCNRDPAAARLSFGAMRGEL